MFHIDGIRIAGCNIVCFNKRLRLATAWRQSTPSSLFLKSPSQNPLRAECSHSVNYQDIVFSILFLCPVEYRKMEERRFFCVPVVASRGGTGLRRVSTGQYLPFTQQNLCSQTFQSATWALPVEISQHIPSSNLDHRQQHMDVLRLLTTDNVNKYTERWQPSPLRKGIFRKKWLNKILYKYGSSEALPGYRDSESAELKREDRMKSF